MKLDSLEAREIIVDSLRYGAPITTKIKDGEIIVTSSYHLIDTEDQSSSDTVTNIRAFDPSHRRMLVRPAHDDRTVIFEHGTGNIICGGGANVTLDQESDMADCFFDMLLDKWIILPYDNTVTVIPPVSAGGVVHYDYVVDSSYTGSDGDSVTLATGATVNIYKTVQAALNAVDAQTGAITIRINEGANAGLYNENITFPSGLLGTEDIYLVGEGPKKITIGTTSGDACTFASGFPIVHLANLRFRGGAGGHSVTSSAGLVQASFVDCDFERSVSADFLGVSSEFAGGQFIHCHFKEGYDTDLGDTPEGVLFIDCHFDDTCEWVSNVVRHYFVNCRFEGTISVTGTIETVHFLNCEFFTGGVAYHSNATDESVQNLAFIGCFFGPTTDSNGAIYFQDSFATNGVVINGNHFARDDASTVPFIKSADANCEGVAITGNNFKRDGDDDYLEDDGAVSITGTFSKSVFGPNTPPNFDVQLDSGSNNLYIGTGTVSGAGAGGAVGGNLSGVDFLVGTATGLLSAEIVVGTSPGGELGGTWGSPTVDATHSGSAHHNTHDSDDVTYTPTTLTDWDGDADPGDVEQALDQLAERVDDLEGAPSPATDEIVDADGDTKIQVEESADEDKIRMDTGGTERVVIDSTGVNALGPFRAGATAAAPDVDWTRVSPVGDPYWSTDVPLRLKDYTWPVATTPDSTPGYTVLWSQGGLPAATIEQAGLGITFNPGQPLGLMLARGAMGHTVPFPGGDGFQFDGLMAGTAEPVDAQTSNVIDADGYYCRITAADATEQGLFGALILRRETDSNPWMQFKYRLAELGNKRFFIGYTTESLATMLGSQLPASGNFAGLSYTPVDVDSGTANAAVTTVATGLTHSLTDTREAWTTNQWVGYTVTCNGQTMIVHSNTATVLSSSTLVPGGGWSADPGAGAAWSLAQTHYRWIKRNGTTTAVESASTAARVPIAVSTNPLHVRLISVASGSLIGLIYDNGKPLVLGSSSLFGTGTPSATANMGFQIGVRGSGAAANLDIWSGWLTTEGP